MFSAIYLKKSEGKIVKCDRIQVALTIREGLFIPLFYNAVSTHGLRTRSWCDYEFRIGKYMELN
jgi:hypothetical protein